MDYPRLNDYWHIRYGEAVGKEINNVSDFLKTDKRMEEKEFIEHHNFVVVHKWHTTINRRNKQPKIKDLWNL